MSDRCYVSALRILRYRFNSAAELRRKLASKDFDKDTIAETISRLTEEKWLDDARFAAAFVRTRLQKRIGPRRIRSELIHAGVANDVIDDVLRANSDADGEHERALASAMKRVTILKRRGDDVRNKLTAYLLKQGYDGALVRAVVKEILVAHD